MLSHQLSTAKSEGAVPQQDIAEHLTLDPGDLVFKDNNGVLKLTRSTDNNKYHNVSWTKRHRCFNLMNEIESLANYKLAFFNHMV